MWQVRTSRAIDPRAAALTRDQSPLADAIWYRCFVAAFGADHPALAFHELHRGGELVAVLPVVREGRAARAWSSLENEHNPYWLPAGHFDQEGAAQLLGHALERAEYVFLRRLPIESAACMAFQDAAAARGLQVSLIETAGSGDARMVLGGTWESFRASLPKNFQRDLPRKQRQLEKLGTLEVETLTARGPALSNALEECYDVETRGWKGSEGSPIKRDPGRCSSIPSSRISSRLRAGSRSTCCGSTARSWRSSTRCAAAATSRC